MARLLAPIHALGRILAPLGTCANAGLVVGLTTGGMLGLLAVSQGPPTPTTAQLLAIWALTAAFTWLILLFLFVPLSRWSISSVALPSAANALLVSGLTLFLCWALGLYLWGLAVGAIVGVATGLLLCGLYRLAGNG